MWPYDDHRVARWVLDISWNDAGRARAILLTAEEPIVAAGQIICTNRLLSQSSSSSPELSAVCTTPGK
jgi:hypothetical protein